LFQFGFFVPPCSLSRKTQLFWTFPSVPAPSRAALIFPIPSCWFRMRTSSLWPSCRHSLIAVVSASFSFSVPPFCPRPDFSFSPSEPLVLSFFFLSDPKTPPPSIYRGYPPPFFLSRPRHIHLWASPRFGLFSPFPFF